MNRLQCASFGLLLAAALAGCGRSDEVVLPEDPVDPPPPNALQQSGAPAGGADTPKPMTAPPKGM